MTRSLVLMTSLKRNSIEKFMFEEEKPLLYDNTNKYDTCWSSSWQRFLITLVFTGKICFTSKLSATKNSRKFSFCFCILVKCTKPKKASKLDFQILSWFQDENAKRQEFFMRENQILLADHVLILVAFSVIFSVVFSSGFFS